MIHSVRVECDLAYRIKRNLESELTNKIDEMAKLHVDKEFLRSNKLALIQKVKAMRAQVESKRLILEQAQKRVNSKLH